MRVCAASSPNFSQEEIQPEFVVLHYTGCDLKKTLEIFSSPTPGVCAHFVVDTDGSLYDLGNFLSCFKFLKAAHAGESEWKDGSTNWSTFNKFSIGVELVNLNGNLFSYTDAQYSTLSELLQKLTAKFPILNDPKRIIGHEQIAGYRGKSDPGLCFDWKRFFEGTFSKSPAPWPLRPPKLSVSDMAIFLKIKGIKRVSSEEKIDWSQLSSELEEFARSLSPQP